VIESCAKEIEHLVGLRAQRLPVLIREQDVQIEQLLSTLHVIRPRAECGGDLQAISDRDEEELKYLTELHRKMEPFLELVQQREESLLELHATKAEPGKEDGRTEEAQDERTAAQGREEPVPEDGRVPRGQRPRPRMRCRAPQ
jgi:hypothetical protein